jgi:putative ATP-binding cassette transporter
VSKPFFTCRSNWWGVGLLGLLLGLVFVVKGLDIGNSFVYGDLITSATERKAERVFHLALLYAGVFAISAMVAGMLRYTEESLGLRWRDWLTRHLTDRYLAHRSYHRIKETGQLDNPDQRIAEDVKTFTTNTLSIVLIIVNATVALAGFAGVLWSITPWLLAGAVGYAAFGTFMTVVLGRRLVGLDVQQFKKEADFRYELIRVREHADAIALASGEAKENGRVRGRFARVIENFRVIIGVNRNMTFFTSWYGYMTRLIPVLITLPLYIRGEIEFGQVAQAEVGFNFVLDAFSLIVKEFQRITTFAAVVERLGAFYEATEEIAVVSKSPLEIVEDDSRLAYQGLSLETPDDGRLLLDNLSLELPQGKRLLIDGPDGSGRTSLMRATAGLWRQGQGRIVRPPLARMMFLAQQPHLTLGTLRDQLVYGSPSERTIPNERLLEVLQEVQLEAVLERVGGLNVEQRDWSSILSLGEQQTLAFARLLLNEPDFAFLDEATSALAPERVRGLYDLLARTSTTYITVGSGADLFEYHDVLLQFHGDGTWRLSTPVDEPCSADWIPTPPQTAQLGLSES